jgi:chromosome segregation ATPase
MSWLQIIHADSERQGARTLLDSMRQIPAVSEALRLLDESAHIGSVGFRLQAKLLEERQGWESLGGELDSCRSKAASLQHRLDYLDAHPVEQRSREAEHALVAVQWALLEAQREIAEREREGSARAREICELKAQNAELNRLVLKLRGQLSDLTGSGTPQ